MDAVDGERLFAENPVFIEALDYALAVFLERIDLIAGAFGTYLDLPSAMRVGMFPSAPLERFHQVGNAAGMGAKQMLLSLDERREASRLVQRAHYVELTVEPGFTDEFMKAIYLQ